MVDRLVMLLHGLRFKNAVLLGSSGSGDGLWSFFALQVDPGKYRKYTGTDRQ